MRLVGAALRADLNTPTNNTPANEVAERQI